MEIKDEYILVLAILLLIIIGITLVNIFNFMPSYNKCDSAFKIINKCGCIPDEHIAKLFNIKNYTNYKINISLNIPLI